MPLASPTVKSTSSVAPVCSPTQLSDKLVSFYHVVLKFLTFRVGFDWQKQ